MWLSLLVPMTNPGQGTSGREDDGSSDPGRGWTTTDDSGSKADVVFTLYDGERIVKGPLAREGDSEES